MLYVVTGQPGDGKTLYALSRLKKEQEDEKKKSKDKEFKPRATYYFGIAELSPSLGWLPFDDPKLWYDLPSGSRIVIDEAQEIFPPMKAGSTRPESYKRFARHRHQGFDIYLITQNAMNIDFRVRSMCNMHLHVSRNFGMQAATVYQFKEIQNPRDYHAKKDAVKFGFKYPKKNFDLYKSAEVHTHKLNLPVRKLGMIFLMVVAIMYLVYRIYLRFGADRTVSSGAVSSELREITSLGLAGREKKEFEPSQFVPKYKDIPYSADAYQEIVRVEKFPYIDGCMSMVVDYEIFCSCNDQQGNNVYVSTSACMHYINNGSFRFFKTIDDSQRNTQSIRRDNSESAQYAQ